jgi:hypothetical protein
VFEEIMKSLWVLFLKAPMTERRNKVPLMESSSQKFLEKERK